MPPRPRRARFVYGRRSSNSFRTPSHNRSGLRSPALGELDDSLGDDFVGEIAAVRKPKGYASHFEREAQDALGLGVEFGVVQEWGDRHGRPLVVQAGARPVSQPPAPVGAATGGDEVLGAIGGAVCTLADLWHAAAHNPVC